MTKFQKKVKEAIYSTAKSHGHHSARNAIGYIERAFNLKKFDPEISVFMGITAEEEAATSVFLALKKRNYIGADKISHRDHRHKAALYPFCAAVAESLIVLKELHPHIIVQPKSEKSKILIKFKMKTPSGESHEFVPDAPFNFAMKIDEEYYDFSKELEQISAHYQDDLFKIIMDIANLRNKILYASSNGIMKIETDSIDTYLKNQKERVFWLITLFLSIDLYEKQIFIQQAINSFLKILKKLPDDECIDDLLNDSMISKYTLHVDLNTGVANDIRKTVLE